MQVVTSLDGLKGRFSGNSCWIVGCGPSIDLYDHSKLRGKHIFALNAAITLFSDIGMYKNAHWFFRDRRIVREVWQRLESWRKWKIITHKAAYVSLGDIVRLKRRTASTILYHRDSVIHERTVVEDALQVVQMLGFDAVYLLGVDHALIDNQPYAKPFQWKECHFYNPNKPSKSGQSIALGSMVRAMKKIRDKLSIRVLNTSPYYPEDVFEKVDFDDAVRVS